MTVGNKECTALMFISPPQIIFSPAFAITDFAYYFALLLLSIYFVPLAFSEYFVLWLLLIWFTLYVIA